MSTIMPIAASFELYHPSGVRVQMGAVATDYVGLLARVSEALAAGWLGRAPGLEQGEERFDVSAVVRREKPNSDGTETPIVDLYEGDNDWKSLSVYLNTEEDVCAFEAASGLPLAGLPLFPGSAGLKRGTNHKNDTLYVVRAARPFACVCKPNPKYDEAARQAATAKGETYPVAKRKLVRWEGQTTAPPPAAAPAPGTAGKSAVQAWADFLRSDPPLDVLNKRLPEVDELEPEDRAKVQELIRRHVLQIGWRWDKVKKEFYAPQAPASF